MCDLYSWIWYFETKNNLKKSLSYACLPFVYFVLCLDQYSSWEFFGIWVGFIESDKVFCWLRLNYYFITTVFLFKESG